jgi:hypothetical protein
MRTVDTNPQGFLVVSLANRVASLLSRIPLGVISADFNNRRSKPGRIQKSNAQLR